MAKALIFRHNSISLSALSTAVYAAQFTIKSTAFSDKNFCTATRSVISNSRTSVKIYLLASSRRDILRISLPNCPLAPVTRIVDIKYDMILLFIVPIHLPCPACIFRKEVQGIAKSGVWPSRSRARSPFSAIAT